MEDVTEVPVYRGLRDCDVVEGFVVAVDKDGEGYLLKTPPDVDPAFFADGPLLHSIPMLAMTQHPGVYQVEAYFHVSKGSYPGERLQWADEVEWIVSSYWPYSKEITRPF